MSPAAWIVAAIPTLALLSAARATPPPESPRVAILPFETHADEARFATLGAGLQAMLTTDLAVAPSLRIIERDKLDAVRDEIARTRSRDFDPATVVAVGKLLGATHLLTGAIAVMGETMRIDARLIDATRGEVVLADKIEGEAALFFELEKALAHKLVKALDAPLDPKERARLARIHTADLDAFRRFSDGIEAFSQQRFDEAKKALTEALDRDQEFQLARLTLDDYAAIIARLDARRELLVAAERQAAADAKGARAAEQKQIRDRLFRLAADPDESVRLPALYSLFRWYDRRDRHDNELHTSDDAFSLARTCDALFSSYFAEAQKSFPKVPLFGTRDFIGAPPQSAEELKKDQARWLERFLGTGTRQSEAQRHHALLEDLARAVASRDFARHLHLDVRGEARLAERVYRLATERLDPDAVGEALHRGRTWRQRFLELLGRRFRQAGLFDESTRYFAEAGRLADDPNRAAGAAREVEENREIVRFLAAHPSPHLREWLMLGGYRLSPERWHAELVAAFAQSPLPPRARSALASARDVRSADSPYVLIGDRALYPMSETFFATGPRTDPIAAADFDYYREATRSAGESWWKAWYAGQHQGSLAVRFQLGYAPDPTWWHAQLSSNKPDLAAAGFVDARPELVVLFGAVDVDVPALADETGRRRLQRPLRAHGLHVTPDRVALVRVIEPEVRTGYSVARDRLELEVLAERRGAVSDRAKVVLEVDGRRVTARVGSLKLEKTLAEPPTGFVGYAFRGPGHLAILGPKVVIGGR